MGTDTAPTDIETKNTGRRNYPESVRRPKPCTTRLAGSCAYKAASGNDGRAPNNDVERLAIAQSNLHQERRTPHRELFEQLCDVV